MKQELRNSNAKAYVRPFNLKLLDRYVLFVLWFLDPGFPFQFKEMANRIRALWIGNGRKFVVTYLKEATRLVHHFLSGKPATCDMNAAGGPRVASRRGLPLIIPGVIRLQIEADNPVVIRAVLTILSVYRIIKYPGSLKLATITDPFKGLSETLDKVEVAVV